VNKAGKMVCQTLWWIINAIVAGVSNAIAETKNSRMQRIKNMACGYRSRKQIHMAIPFRFGGLDLPLWAIGSQATPTIRIPEEPLLPIQEGMPGLFPFEARTPGKRSTGALEPWARFSKSGWAVGSECSNAIWLAPRPRHSRGQ
jgi:hypothetical protein